MTMSTVVESPAEEQIALLGPRDAGMPMTLDGFDDAEFEEG
jgi:hypothetical protein